MDYEQQLQDLYEALLQPGQIVLDAGAHLGRHTLPIARAVAPTGFVIAVEPLAECVEQLERALAEKAADLAPLVRVIQGALGAESGRHEFFIAADALGFSGLRRRQYDVPTRVKRTQVDVQTVDQLCANLPHVHYMKVDAEGGEYDIFRGAEQTLKKWRPFVTFEFGANSISEYGISTRDMGEFWFARNYHIYDIRGRAIGTVEQFAASAEHQEVWDYLALPEENLELEQKTQKFFASRR